MADLHQPIPDHGQPDGVFEVVVVVLESLTRVEGRVDVRQSHASNVLGGERWQLRKAHERVESVATDQQVGRAWRILRPRSTHQSSFMKQAHLGHSVVVGRDPLVALVSMREKTVLLVRPSQFQTTRVFPCLHGHSLARGLVRRIRGVKGSGASAMELGVGRAASASATGKPLRRFGRRCPFTDETHRAFRSDPLGVRFPSGKTVKYYTTKRAGRVQVIVSSTEFSVEQHDR